MAQSNENNDNALVLMVDGATLGRGDDQLGGVLMRSFLHTLGEAEVIPGCIIFMNTGVKLVVGDSPVLEDLKTLRDQGVNILACGTCLGHFGLKEDIAVGEISNMYDITATMLRAGRVINL
jgi:selenium metabolism protein YedF